MSEALAELGHLALDDLCEQLLTRLARQDDDDVAVLAARLGPQL